MKTDIVDATPKLAQLSQTEMGRQRKQHKQFISVFLEEVARLAYSGSAPTSIVVTGRVKESAKGTSWERNFQELTVKKPVSKKLQSIMDEYGANRLLA